MAKRWELVEDLFPRFQGKETVPEQIRALVDFLYALTEQLQYTLSNLSGEDWNGAALEEEIRGPLAEMKAMLASMGSREGNVITLGDPEAVLRIVGKTVCINDTEIGGEADETS